MEKDALQLFVLKTAIIGKAQALRCIKQVSSQYGPIAQLEEPPAHNRSVPGSNPGRPIPINITL